MSTVTVKTTVEIDKAITPFKLQIREGLIEATAKALNAKPQGIIIDFETWGEPAPEQAPAILLRGETSIHRRQLLREWGEELLNKWAELSENLKLPLDKNLRIAAKPYVVDLEWVEYKD